MIIENTEQAKKRISICLECEYLVPFLKICKICKCVMPIKVKLQKVKCPKNKW